MFGIQVQKFSLMRTVPTKADCNVAQMSHYHSVKGSARYIAQNHTYGGKFKSRSRFDDLRYKALTAIYCDMWYILGVGYCDNTELLPSPIPKHEWATRACCQRWITFQ